jgi:hypothetical protein
MEILEFQEWLDRCCDDAERKLGIPKEDMVWALLKKAEQLFLGHLIERKEKRKEVSK